MTAVVEAVFGQLCLITVVALVVQNLGQRSRIGRKMEEQLENDDQNGEAAGAEPFTRRSEDGGRASTASACVSETQRPDQCLSATSARGVRTTSQYASAMAATTAAVA
jgi:hypothetical protein